GLPAGFERSGGIDVARIRRAGYLLGSSDPEGSMSPASGGRATCWVRAIRRDRCRPHQAGGLPAGVERSGGVDVARIRRAGYLLGSSDPEGSMSPALVVEVEVLRRALLEPEPFLALVLLVGLLGLERAALVGLLVLERGPHLGARLIGRGLDVRHR